MIPATFVIGLFGPLVGLSDHQCAELQRMLHEAHKSFQGVELRVYFASSRRKDDGPDVMVDMAQALVRRHASTALSMHPLPRDWSPAHLPSLKACDLLLLCPGEHACTQRARVWQAKRFMDAQRLKSRIVFPWRNPGPNDIRGM